MISEAAKKIGNAYSPYEKLTISVQMALDLIKEHEALYRRDMIAHPGTVSDIKLILNMGLGFKAEQESKK